MSNAVVFQIKYVAKNPPRNLSAERAVAYSQERQFFDWTAPFNLKSYVLNDKKVERYKDFAHYASREGNLGMFDQDHVLTAEEIENVKTSLQNTDSHIWHGFISFDEKTSEKFQTQDQAMHFLKQHFNDFIERSHLDADNICLVASLHRDTENRHIHFSFFEKEPRHIDKNGQVCYSSKGNFKQTVIDNWLVSANMAVAEPDDLYASRNAVIAKLREMKASVRAEFTDQEMQLRLLSLARKFPTQGRLSYASANMMGLRSEIDQLATFILCANPKVKELHQEFMRKLNDRNKQVLEIKLRKENKISSRIDYITDLRNDYKARVGNLVIALAKEMRRQYQPVYCRESDKQKKYAARQMRRHAARVYTNFTGKLLYTLGQVQKGMEANFTDSVKDAENMLLREMMLEEQQGVSA